jgi:hypothetical protein
MYKKALLFYGHFVNRANLKVHKAVYKYLEKHEAGSRTAGHFRQTFSLIPL